MKLFHATMKVNTCTVYEIGLPSLHRESTDSLILFCKLVGGGGGGGGHLSSVPPALFLHLCSHDQTYFLYVFLAGYIHSSSKLHMYVHSSSTTGRMPLKGNHCTMIGSDFHGGYK